MKLECFDVIAFGPTDQDSGSAILDHQARHKAECYARLVKGPSGRPDLGRAACVRKLLGMTPEMCKRTVASAPEDHDAMSRQIMIFQAVTEGRWRTN